MLSRKEQVTVDKPQVNLGQGTAGNIKESSGGLWHMYNTSTYTSIQSTPYSRHYLQLHLRFDNVPTNHCLFAVP